MAHRCPEWLSALLDNPVRALIMKPERILRPYVREGSMVADVGCGPGFFIPCMARLVGARGRVFAVDVQQGMLDRVRRKLEGSGLGERVVLHRCAQDRLALPEPVDFALLFWMVHETPYAGALFRELLAGLKPSGRLLVTEPVAHVSRRDFERMLSEAEAEGLCVIERPRLWGNRSALLAAGGEGRGGGS